MLKFAEHALFFGSALAWAGGLVNHSLCENREHATRSRLVQLLSALIACVKRKLRLILPTSLKLIPGRLACTLGKISDVEEVRKARISGLTPQLFSGEVIDGRGLEAPARAALS